ncbi:MAG: hypothetical protein M1834_005193 [Cirrosporium novae-zelandiae]|nr:MAG: hypothetical protein M1834_005193 [Cirrosporium novae-zelandiae]
MSETKETGKQPRLHNEVYAAIDPEKFVGKLDGQVVVITGAAGTIGRAMAECFSRAGAFVCLLDINGETLEDLARKCMDLGAKGALVARCDVTEYVQCERVLEKIKEDVGPIEVMVNVAGIMGVRSFHAGDPGRFIEDLAVNLFAPYFFMRLVLPDFMSRRKGCIINLASRSGTVDQPCNVSYNTSKAAVIRMTACIQMEVDLAGHKDIHLYALHPGAVPSALTSSVKTDSTLSQTTPKFVNEILPQWVKNFKTSPYLVGMTSVALATGIAKDVLRGRYYDCEQDLDDVLSQKEILQKNPELYGMGVPFLGGLPNDGGMELREGERPFEFGDEKDWGEKKKGGVGKEGQAGGDDDAEKTFGI